eukprot:912173-Rhodomonas_salina.2
MRAAVGSSMSSASLVLGEYVCLLSTQTEVTRPYSAPAGPASARAACWSNSAQQCLTSLSSPSLRSAALRSPSSICLRSTPPSFSRHALLTKSGRTVRNKRRSIVANVSTPSLSTCLTPKLPVLLRAATPSSSGVDVSGGVELRIETRPRRA